MGLSTFQLPLLPLFLESKHVPTVYSCCFDIIFIGPLLHHGIPEAIQRKYKSVYSVFFYSLWNFIKIISLSKDIRVSCQSFLRTCSFATLLCSIKRSYEMHNCRSHLYNELFSFHSFTKMWTWKCFERDHLLVVTLLYFFKKRILCICYSRWRCCWCRLWRCAASSGEKAEGSIRTGSSQMPCHIYPNKRHRHWYSRHTANGVLLSI